MRKFLATSALATTLALPAAAFDIDSMTDAEREAFGEAVRAYLLENPQTIMDAVELLETRQQEEAAANDIALVAAYNDALTNDGYSYVGGNPEGDVTIVEFVDYRCGYCRRAHDEVKTLIESDGNIRIIVKEFPILGENSLISSRFAVAVKQVAGGEAYAAANDALIRLQGDMSEPVLRRLANTLDVDADAVLAAMETPAVTEEISKTRALAQALQINGTPTFVFGTELVRGYVPLEGMQQIVAAEREKS